MNIWQIICVSVSVWLCLFIFKCQSAMKADSKVLNAIDKYTKLTKDYETGIKTIESMTDVDKMTFRFWDWGYKNILPKEYFEIIEPYID